MCENILRLARRGIPKLICNRNNTSRRDIAIMMYESGQNTYTEVAFDFKPTKLSSYTSYYKYLYKVPNVGDIFEGLCYHDFAKIKEVKIDIGYNTYIAEIDDVRSTIVVHDYQNNDIAYNLWLIGEYGIPRILMLFQGITIEIYTTEKIDTKKLGFVHTNNLDHQIISSNFHHNDVLCFDGTIYCAFDECHFLRTLICTTFTETYEYITTHLNYNQLIQHSNGILNTFASLIV